MPENSSRQASIDRLKELTLDIRFAMLGTHCEDGELHSRPMFTRDLDDDGNLWFFTYADSHKVSEIEQDGNVSVSYADPDSNRWISIAGHASVIEDKARARELWDPMLQAWFPNGIDDPNMALLKVQISSAQLWVHPVGRMIRLYGLARAIVTGKPTGELESYRVDQVELEEGPPH